jgi:hypothetical protein
MTQTNEIEDEKKETQVETPTPETVDETRKAEEPAKEQDDTRAKESFKEAMRLTKENETLKQEKVLKDKMVLVAKDHNKIHEIAQEDPEVADQICQEYWGVSYSEATKDSKKADTPDPQTVARQVYKEEKQAEEKSKIEDYEMDFFISRKIEVGSPKFKKIMSTYGKMTPQTLDDSKQFLEMTYKHCFPDEENIVPAYNTEIGGAGALKKSELTDVDREIMKSKGWTPEQYKEFQASNLY